MTTANSPQPDRTRVLCVSGDRQTRATVTRALADVEASVAIGQRYADAIDRLESDTIDTVVLDAGTIWNASRLLDRLESEWPGTPAVVYGDGQRARTLYDEATGQVSLATDPAELPAAIELHLADATPRIIDTVVGQVKRRLADARNAGDIERAVREGFTGDDQYAFAWLGEYDRGEGEIVPWLTDQSAIDWPIQRTFSLGDGTQPLLEHVLRTGDLEVVSPVAENVEAVPLGSVAVDRDVVAAAAAPLATDDDRYGVLVIYARGPLTDGERTAIESITETASYALESVSIRGQLSQQAQSLRRYERLVEAAGDGMYVVDDEGDFTTVNDALVEMTGYSREGLLGEHRSMLFEPHRRRHDDRSAAVDEGESTLTPIDPFESVDTAATFETVLTTKSGDRIPCETQAAVVGADADEGVERTVGVVRDITTRKARERKLREQNERLDAFARIVSHDLRNPLAVAQGYLDLARETGDDAHFEQIRDGLERMEAIIGDVLTVAREGEWATDVEPLELEAVATEAWANVDTDEATMTVADSITVDGDRSPLLRLFENLFRNALEHGRGDAHGTGGGGDDESGQLSVRVGTITDGGRRGFYVADDGTGISADVRDDVFDSSVSTGVNGIGLGLWVVREVAHGHGWEVEVTDSDRGGARFEFVW